MDWPINSSIITSFGSLFSVSLICAATEKKEIIKTINKIINIVFEDKLKMWKKI